ncbi:MULTISPECIES: ABC transporter permease [unclassified Mesorhizobium]|uniref:ABC transporter permease n=1 Tax=unclassified Mesorhizobium TaxID=325217 RepID=UPI000F761444|nr:MULTISPECIES: ABC transporter permease [unclassified Mesorhizobium]AZO63598.1 ABC transporter permease [Mesorhizobium sp. M6A.T.Cr.TU.016.01.1.1]RUU31603.1 ABC transporter permease subunit [Mesorhizobium sp. M6A.T.Ce.TU.016.01.1.1]RUU46876.1 ABC transporter permease subunit [Mesorhizobium sp. M6A.T.Ce.TU.002.03.1.1]RUV02936.1 ABC transporter permease subunit [Mesorhizobium sp. M6A.T.Cr.TU.017.01.1.1]RWN67013.1 MAG: ABC transporter permease subunit [Mesorhizobium sp.]
MITYLGRRAFHSILSVIGLLTLVFFLTRLTGDPSALYLPLDSTAEARAAFARLNGLDQPIYWQFLEYLRDLLQLDFGESLRQNRSAMQVALEAFPETLKLAAVAITLSTALAILVGSLAAARPGSMFDRVASLVSLAGASAPDFWVAIVGILVFAVGLGLLPTSGTGTWAHWIMPVFVLMLRPFGLLVQVVRGTMLSALASPYIKTARAKGLPRQKIIFGHALRNSLLPVVTVAGDLATSLVNGAVVVESIFGWPGIGKLMIDSIIQRDFAVVQSTILVTATAIFILNIAIDLLYAVLDPRIRY